MSQTQLDTPFLDGALRSTNYFNGRILSREDMQRDRDAQRALNRRLGLGLGHGVVCGLEVTAKALGGSSVTAPVVTVSAGMAVNRKGDTVALSADVDVSLLQPAPATTTAASPAAGGFDDCAPLDDGVYVTGTGVYLLTVAPASATKGLAPVSGLGNAAATCNAKEVVEGVQFRLFQVQLSNAELADTDHLQNVAAYKFLFADGLGVDSIRDPYGTATAAALLQPAPTDCDVPLAIFNWTATGGLVWVDNWAARRRLAPAAAMERPLASRDATRARAAEAAALQFEEQVQSLFDGGEAMETTLATQVFRYLPAAGIAPLFGLGASRGFDRLTFLSNWTTRGPLYIEGAEVAPLLRASLDRPAIDLDPSDPQKRQLIWLYLVRENLQAQGTGAQPYFLFASGQLPPFGRARLDVARAGFASVAVI